MRRDNGTTENAARVAGTALLTLPDAIWEGGYPVIDARGCISTRRQALPCPRKCGAERRQTEAGGHLRKSVGRGERSGSAKEPDTLGQLQALEDAAEGHLFI